MWSVLSVLVSLSQNNEAFFLQEASVEVGDGTTESEPSQRDEVEMKKKNKSYTK